MQIKNAIPSPFEEGEKVKVYVKELDKTVNGTIEREYNHIYSIVNIGNLYVEVLPKWYDNILIIKNELIEKCNKK